MSMSQDRFPIVAGQFYPQDPETLSGVVRAALAKGKERQHPTLLAMAPHAGYMFSGRLAGETLGAANLAQTVILLGPNHTGLGAPMAVWPHGRWHIPGGALEVDAALAQALLEAEPSLTADTAAHLREHSLEVLLPFLFGKNPAMRIVPIAVADPRPQVLAGVAARMAEVTQAWEEPVSVVVSSDMNHFADDATTRKVDRLAIDRILALDPMGLYGVVREHGISMCGVYPMTLGLQWACIRGAKTAELVGYATSADAGGGTDRVVGYCGVLVA
jgi:hypothetical protein